METRRSRINAQQLHVLRWIADGCPDGVMTGSSYKVSSNVLRDRGLVTISKRGGWSATITDAGTYFLKHGKHPDAVATNASSHVPSVDARTSVLMPRSREHIDPDDLIKRLRNEGGTLVISESSRELTVERRAAYRRAIFEINQQQLAGPEASLRHTGRDRGDLVLRLVEAANSDGPIWSPEEMTAARAFVDRIRASANVLLISDSHEVKRLDTLATVAQTAGLLATGESIKQDRPLWGSDRELGTSFSLQRDFKPSVEPVEITVLARVGRYSPAVSWYRTETDRQEVTKPHLSRTLLILETIAREAIRRGWELRANQPSDTGNGYTRRIRFVDGQFKVIVGAHCYWLRIKERSAPGGKHMGYSYPDRRPVWQQRRTTEFISTGSLEIESAVGKYGDQSLRRLEERLPLLFVALEAKALGDDYQAALAVRTEELRQEARQRLADERRRRWEEVRAAAIEQVIESHRARMLRDQIERWELVGRIDQFFEAASAGHGVEPDWLGWIRDYRERIDPLTVKLTMPSPPSITNDDLAPFMHGLDPCDPNAPRLERPAMSRRSSNPTRPCIDGRTPQDP